MSADNWAQWRDAGVIALFPELPADNGGHLCQSFCHIGQHGAADYRHVIKYTDLALPQEYAELAAELRESPYRYTLAVRHRATPAMHAKRRSNLERLMDN